jgi:hypothetical protein
MLLLSVAVAATFNAPFPIRRSGDYRHPESRQRLPVQRLPVHEETRHRLPVQRLPVSEESFQRLPSQELVPHTWLGHALPAQSCAVMAFVLQSSVGSSTKPTFASYA